MSRRFLSGNKGVFFSLIAILLLVLIAMQFIGRQRLVVQSEFDVLDTQFKIANDLVNNVERSILPRMLEADIGLALDAIARHINNTRHVEGEDVPWLTPDELQIMLNDTVMNSTDMPIDVRGYIGNGTIIFQLAQFRESVQRELHIDITVSPINVSVWQSNESGYKRVIAQLKARMYLDAGFANWSRDYDNITTLVDITHLSDPYIMVGEPDINASITFAETPIDFETLKSFVVNRSYTYDKYAPSFLQRFSGDLSRSDCCGIESVVSLNANLPPAAPLYRRSMVDWCYFSPDYPCRSIDDFKKNYWTLEAALGSTDETVTSRDSSLPFYALYLDSYHLRKFNLFNYVIDQNECRCHIEQEEPTYEGPGCIGTAVDEEC